MWVFDALNYICTKYSISITQLLRYLINDLGMSSEEAVNAANEIINNPLITCNGVMLQFIK